MGAFLLLGRPPEFSLVIERVGRRPPTEALDAVRRDLGLGPLTDSTVDRIIV